MFYQWILDVVMDWVKVSNEVINWFSAPLWTDGPAPYQLLTFYGLSLLIVILVAKLIF